MASPRHPVLIEEEVIDIARPVRATRDLRGLDPLLIANEGRFVAFVPAVQAAAIAAMASIRPGAKPRTIGPVAEHGEPGVLGRRAYGRVHRLAMPSGNVRPRIC